jgi:hypothetical protein
MSSTIPWSRQLPCLARYEAAAHGSGTSVGLRPWATAGDKLGQQVRDDEHERRDGDDDAQW